MLLVLLLDLLEAILVVLQVHDHALVVVFEPLDLLLAHGFIRTRQLQVHA